MRLAASALILFTAGATAGQAQTLTTLTSLNGTNGSAPAGGLTLDANGNLLGMASAGGAYGDGTVFELAKSGSGYASTATALASFNGTNGNSPAGSLIIDANGNLLGTTSYGGANGAGEVFELAKSGSSYASTPTRLASFSTSGSTGAYPAAGVTAIGGNLFGTTFSYGTTGNGNVFELAKSGASYASTTTTIANFGGTTTGSASLSNLIADANGNLFGTTWMGGANGGGVVFEIPKSGASYASTPTVLATFNYANGGNPLGGLTMDANGDLFGTTNFGGANSDGVVFEIAKSGSSYASSPTVLASFNGANGNNAAAGDIGNGLGLLIDSYGNLFGVSAAGGANGDGTVFELPDTTSGYASALVTLASFNGTNGSYPIGTLIADASGDLFGTTQNGGANNAGTVYEITNSGYGQQYVVTEVDEPAALGVFSAGICAVGLLRRRRQQLAAA